MIKKINRHTFLALITHLNCTIYNNKTSWYNNMGSFKMDKKLISNLNKLFHSKKFMESIVEERYYDSTTCYEKMGRVLEYYIITRDENISYTYKEIDEKLNKIVYDQEMEDNVLKNGYVTHSFNGNKKTRVQKYGLAYMEEMDEKEKQEIIEMRKALNELEEALGTSHILRYQEQFPHDSQSVFFCSPGAKTFHYACKRSPERLYFGPLKNSEQEDMIVGEKKESFYLRYINSKIDKELSDQSEERIQEIKEIAKKVIHYYCKELPMFAMIDLPKIKDVLTSVYHYNADNAVELEKHIIQATNFGGVYDYFTRSGNDNVEHNNLENLVTLAKYISKDAISLVECMSDYEMRQLYARSKGLKIGEYILIDEPKEITIKQLTQIIKDCDNSNELKELQETYLKTKQQLEEKIEKKTEIINKKYPNKTIEEINQKIEDRVNELTKNKEEILKSDYIHKDGIDTQYGLENALEGTDKIWQINEIIKNDCAIKADPLQYQSNIHGMSHTRRVSFFAYLIMNEEKTDMKTMEIVKAIINNHDIGRINDIEDKEHGARSVELLEQNSNRMDGFNNEDVEIIKFVIKEHSLSNKQNKEDLDKIFEEKIEQEYNEKMAKIPRGMDKQELHKEARNIIIRKYEKQKNRWKHILDICKDADKLDRVRLDPRGVIPQEGLDSSRLSLDISKKYENVAYESLNKITDILDIEYELAELKKDKKLVEEIKEDMVNYNNKEEFEKEMNSARNNCKVKAQEFLSTIVENKQLSKIKQIPEKIRKLFMKTREKNVEEIDK